MGQSSKTERVFSSSLFVSTFLSLSLAYLHLSHSTYLFFFSLSLADSSMIPISFFSVISLAIPSLSVSVCCSHSDFPFSPPAFFLLLMPFGSPAFLLAAMMLHS